MTPITEEGRELLPCPFCGGACAVTVGHSAAELPWSDDGGVFFRVYCAGCQARQLFHETASEAIATWNTRAKHDTPSGRERAEVEKDAMHYRWLADRFLGADFDWNESGKQVLVIEWPGGPVYGCLTTTLDVALSQQKGAEHG